MSDKGRHAFSHMLLAGTTIWCLYHTDKSGEWKWIYGTYGTMCLYSFIGIWRYGNPQYGDDAANLYEISHYCMMAFAFPCAVTDLYIHYGYPVELSAIHAAIPVIPVGMYFTQSAWEQDLCDAMILGTVISCAAISFLNDNYFGLITALNYAVTHFVFGKQDFSEVPRKVFYNTGLCFFAFYAYRALAEAGLKV